MGSDLVPVFMRKAVLAAEIERLRAGHSLEQLERFGHDGAFYLDVAEDDRADDSFQFWESSRLFCEALDMGAQLIDAAQPTGKRELVHAAEALGRHLGAFSCGMCHVLPYNEYKLKRCTIIHAESAARLHQSYEQTPVEPLRPLFAGYCRASPIEYGQLPYRWITSFDCLLDCANAFDALLRQAISTDRTLYVWVSY